MIPSRSTRLPDYQTTPGSAGLGFTIITRDMMSETREPHIFRSNPLRFIIIIIYVPSVGTSLKFYSLALGISNLSTFWQLDHVQYLTLYIQRLIPVIRLGIERMGQGRIPLDKLSSEWVVASGEWFRKSKSSWYESIIQEPPGWITIELAPSWAVAVTVDAPCHACSDSGMYWGMFWTIR